MAGLLFASAVFSQWNTLYGFKIVTPDDYFQGFLKFDVADDNRIYTTASYGSNSSPHPTWYKVIMSEDGGNSWINLNVPVLSPCSNDNLICTSSQEIILMEGGIYNGILRYTSNGGASWHYLGQGTYYNGYFQEGDFLDSQNGLVLYGYIQIVPDRLFKIKNGEVTFTQIDSLLIEKASIQFVDDTTAFMLCRDTLGSVQTQPGNNMLLKTTDFGDTWTQVFKTNDYGLNHFNFASANDGVMVGDSGKILHTYDACATWQDESIDPSKAVTNITSRNGVYACVGSAGLIVRKENTFSAWDYISFGQSDYQKIRLNTNLVAYVSDYENNLIRSDFYLSLSNSEIVNEATLYPNPCYDKLNYCLNAGKPVQQIEIYAVTGKRVQNVDSGFNGKLDVTALPAGVYSINFKTGEQKFCSRFIKL
jgi:photosystem II stability/assembly factor-like uncharacterized protein